MPVSLGKFMLLFERENARKSTNSESIKTHIKITTGTLERDENLKENTMFLLFKARDSFCLA